MLNIVPIPVAEPQVSFTEHRTQRDQQNFGNCFKDVKKEGWQWDLSK